MSRKTDLIIIAIVAVSCAVALYGTLGYPRDKAETMTTRHIGVDYVEVEIPGDLWERIVRVSSRMELSPEALIRETLTEECEYHEEKDSTGWQD